MRLVMRRYSYGGENECLGRTCVSPDASPITWCRRAKVIDVVCIIYLAFSQLLLWSDSVLIRCSWKPLFYLKRLVLFVINGTAAATVSSTSLVVYGVLLLIGDHALINAKLQTLEHRRTVARLSVFYRIRFSESAKELQDLIPPSTFLHRDTRHGRSLHRHVVDMPPCRMSWFGSSFLMHTATE